MANFDPGIQLAQPRGSLICVATLLRRMRTGAGRGADSYRRCVQEPGQGTRGKGRARVVLGSDTPRSVVLSNRLGIQPAHPGFVSCSLSVPVGNDFAGAVDQPRDSLVVD